MQVADGDQAIGRRCLATPVWWNYRHISLHVVLVVRAHFGVPRDLLGHVDIAMALSLMETRFQLATTLLVDVPKDSLRT